MTDRDVCVMPVKKINLFSVTVWKFFFFGLVRDDARIIQGVIFFSCRYCKMPVPVAARSKV